MSFILICPLLTSIKLPPASCMRRSCRSLWTSLQLNLKLLQTSQLSPKQTVTRTATRILTSTATRKMVSLDRTLLMMFSYYLPKQTTWPEYVRMSVSEYVFFYWINYPDYLVNLLLGTGPWLNVWWGGRRVSLLCLHYVCFLEEIAAPEPEPVPVVEKPVRSRGKAPVTTRTSSRRQTKVRHILPTSTSA